MKTWTVSLTSTVGDMQVMFENVEAANEQQAVNKCLAQFAVQNHWSVLGTQCKPDAGQ